MKTITITMCFLLTIGLAGCGKDGEPEIIPVEEGNDNSSNGWMSEMDEETTSLFQEIMGEWKLVEAIPESHTLSGIDYFCFYPDGTCTYHSAPESKTYQGKFDIIKGDNWNVPTTDYRSLPTNFRLRIFGGDELCQVFPFVIEGKKMHINILGFTYIHTALMFERVNDEPLSNEGNDYKPIELTRAEQELVTANNDFAFNLFRKAGPRPTNAADICFVEPNKSTILSPISITYALGMLNNGAAGETQAQINKVLGFGETGADGINAFCQKMLTEAPKLDKLTKVMIANTIYINKGYQLKPDFVTKAKSYYDAEPETRDFADGKTMDVINQWGSDHTEKMIEKVLNEDEFNPLAVSYLLNAIYFKGAWAEKFDKANTKDEAFRKEDNQEVQVPMMHQEHEFNYTEDEDCQALCLPYGNNAYRMTILLPKEGRTVYSLAQKLSAKTWQRYQWMGSTAIVDVKLPRFESKTGVDLKPVMSALGMPNAFDYRLAEFPNFCNVPIFIDLMKQVARIKLSEEGTEAAAVTMIGLFESINSTPKEPKHVNFHATSPFIYVISEQSTGAIFFIGQYMGD